MLIEGADIWSRVDPQALATLGFAALRVSAGAETGDDAASISGLDGAIIGELLQRTLVPVVRGGA